RATQRLWRPPSWKAWQAAPTPRSCGVAPRCSTSSTRPRVTWSCWVCRPIRIADHDLGVALGGALALEFAGARHETLAVWRRAQGPQDRLGEQPVIADRNESAEQSAVEDLRRAARAIRADDRAAAGQGLDQHARHAFELRRQHEQRRPRHEWERVRPLPQKVGAILEAEARDQALERGPLRPFTQHDETHIDALAHSGKRP